MRKAVAGAGVGLVFRDIAGSRELGLYLGCRERPHSPATVASHCSTAKGGIGCDRGFYRGGKIAGPAVDKPPHPTYYSSIMATERIQ